MEDHKKIIGRDPKEEEIALFKRRVSDLEAQLLKVTSAPLLVELELPNEFSERTFSEAKNEVSAMGQAKPISTPELHEVDTSYFHFTDVMDKFIAVESAHRENNRSNDDVAKMIAGKISKVSSSRGNEIRNTLRVFFGFCKRVFGKADFRHILDERVIAAFPRWYKQMGRQPSTISNHLKTIKAFMKYLMGQQVFFNYIPKINSVIETIKPLQAVFSKLANSAKYLLTDEKMRLLGAWLTEPEFLLLNKFVCDFLVKKFGEDEDFVKEKSQRTSLSRANVALIMDHVYILGLMYLGGQRNQFVASLSTKNVVFEGSSTKYLKTHEKVTRQKVDYFKFPLTFSVMIRVWMTRYLPLVRSSDDVEACWVSSAGMALSHGKMGERVAPVVAMYFPGRRITPIYFRRAIVTFIRGKSFSSGATGVDSFFKEKLAVLMNTSPDIIDLHYDRMHRADVNKQTLDTVNENVGIGPTEALADLIRDLAREYDAGALDFTKDALEVVSHQFLSAYNPQFTVKFKDGDKTLNWTDMSPLLHLVDIYWAKIGGPSTKPLVPVLPKSWGSKSRKGSSSPISPSKVEVRSASQTQHQNEGDFDDGFGLDPVTTSVEEDSSLSVDLLSLVNTSVLIPSQKRSAAVDESSADPAPALQSTDPSTTLSPSPFKAKQTSLLNAFAKPTQQPISVIGKRKSSASEADFDPRKKAKK